MTVVGSTQQSQGEFTTELFDRLVSAPAPAPLDQANAPRIDLRNTQRQTIVSLAERYRNDEDRINPAIRAQLLEQFLQNEVVADAEARRSADKLPFQELQALGEFILKDTPAGQYPLTFHRCWPALSAETQRSAVKRFTVTYPAHTMMVAPMVDLTAVKVQWAKGPFHIMAEARQSVCLEPLRGKPVYNDGTALEVLFSRVNSADTLLRACLDAPVWKHREATLRYFYREYPYFILSYLNELTTRGLIAPERVDAIFSAGRVRAAAGADGRELFRTPKNLIPDWRFYASDGELTARRDAYLGRRPSTDDQESVDNLVRLGAFRNRPEINRPTAEKIDAIEQTIARRAATAILAALEAHRELLGHATIRKICWAVLYAGFPLPDTTDH